MWTGSKVRAGAGITAKFGESVRFTPTAPVGWAGTTVSVVTGGIISVGAGGGAFSTTFTPAFAVQTFGFQGPWRGPTVNSQASAGAWSGSTIVQSP